MRILVVATKSPWPPRDGGRLALWWMLRALAARGHALLLLAPVAAAEARAAAAALAPYCEAELLPLQPRPWPRAALAAFLRGRAVTVMRHRQPALQQRLSGLLSSWRPDLVHVEQLQAWANAAPAHRRVARVLRLQNVESALWRDAAGPPWRDRLLRLEGARVRRDECRALDQADAALAITSRDAAQLRGWQHEAEPVPVEHWAPPFPAELPPGPALPGAPALVLFGSADWRPNRAAAQWWVDAVWPRLREALPAARLHVFGMALGAHAGVVGHAPPEDAQQAFAANAIAVLPLWVGSGIRMRILEAWARGLPVVATTAAAAGLVVEDGEHLLLADNAGQFVAAIARLHGDPALAERLRCAGRDYLRRHHDPKAQAEALLRQYERARALFAAEHD